MYHLKKGQIFELTANSEESKVEHHCIEFISGITRTALISLFNGETMPVGFFKEQSISLSGNRLKYFRLQLLALNDSTFKITKINHEFPRNSDLTCSQWSFQLCAVKSSAQIEIRIIRLITILIYHFVTRGIKSYKLPFNLSHAQIALLVGCTRSTVTRQFGLFRDQNLISPIHQREGISISEELIESELNFVEQLQMN